MRTSYRPGAAVCVLRKPENAKLGEKTFEWLQCLNILMQPINMRLDHEDGHQYFKIFAEFVIVVDDALIMRLMLDNKDFRNLLLLASSDEDDDNRLLIDGLTPRDYAQRVGSLGVLGLLEKQ